MKHEEISFQTKRALADALKLAMKKKPFKKITVSELIQMCDMNRKTFYYHFEDIYDLLKWTFEQEAIDIVKHFDLMSDYQEAINFVMDYIEENDYIINCAYDSIGRDELKRFLYADFLEVGNSLIGQAEELSGKRLEEGYKEFLNNFFMEAIAGIMVEWIKDREHRNREVVIEYIVRTIKGSLLGILEADDTETLV